MNKEAQNIYEMTNKEAQIIIGNIPVYPDDCYSIAEYQWAKSMAIEALEQQPNHRCNSCIHLEEQDGSNCYACIKGMADNFEAQLCEEDCVNRTELIQKLNAWDSKAHGIPNYAWKVIKEMPSVTPERPRGEWIKVDDEEPIAYDCSECDAMVSRKYNYCPECGADMNEGEKNEINN